MLRQQDIRIAGGFGASAQPGMDWLRLKLFISDIPHFIVKIPPFLFGNVVSWKNMSDRFQPVKLSYSTYSIWETGTTWINFLNDLHSSSSESRWRNSQKVAY